MRLNCRTAQPMQNIPTILFPWRLIFIIFYPSSIVPSQRSRVCHAAHSVPLRPRPSTSVRRPKRGRVMAGGWRRPYCPDPAPWPVACRCSARTAGYLLKRKIITVTGAIVIPARPKNLVRLLVSSNFLWLMKSTTQIQVANNMNAQRRLALHRPCFKPYPSTNEISETNMSRSDQAYWNWASSPCASVSSLLDT